MRSDTRLGKTVLLLGAGALIWAVIATFFTVDVTEYGVVSRFGRVVRILDQPGLYLKSPLDRVIRLDRRLLYSRPARAEYLTADKKNVVVRSLATWRIADPLRFLETLRTRANAEERLADLILGEIGAVLGRYPFSALVSSGASHGRFATVVSDVAAAVAESVRPAFGIDVVDVDVRRLYLPEQNKQSVFERMKAERGRIAAQYRSEGERDAQALIAKADAERTRLMAAAYEQAERIRAEGEAEAIRVYAEAFGQAPEFYKFQRTLEAYRKVLDDTTTLFLPADAEVFGLLQFDLAPAGDGTGREPPPTPKPDELAARAGEAGLPTVVTNEVHYADAGAHRLQDVLVCIRHGATLEDAQELLLPNAEYRLKTGDELERIGAGLPDERSRRAWREGMARANAIGQACSLEMGFERYRFPGFSVPEGETAFSYLYQLAHDGLLRRYRPITKQAVKQLAHELDIIERTNLAEFFLIVWDLMEFARRGGIIGQGRGSAGDSIVAYCLGITKVDPIEHKLLFERFINEARALPDIDIDFDVNRREEVIQYLYTKYGADHAAIVCTVVTYRARSAVREVAKALGFPAEGIDALAKALDTRDATDVARDLALDGSFAWLFDELGVDMAEAAVPPGRDGRGAALVPRESDSSWNGRPRPKLDPSAAPRPVSEGGWVPPKRARVLDASVTTVKHESEQTKRYARSGELSGGELRLPEPRDNGSPGPSSERPPIIRIDPESGMPVEGCRRPRVVPDTGVGGVARVAPVPGSHQIATTLALGGRESDSGGRERDSAGLRHRFTKLHEAHTPPREVHPPPNGDTIARWELGAAGLAGGPAGDRAGDAPPKNRWQWLLQLCAEIDGFPRHLGIHVGGMLVTRTPLIDLVPIERATMPNRVVTQYD
ncbi:MAG: SPFH domain-containing protein, partial [Geminicoccaceae bacterium]